MYLLNRNLFLLRLPAAAFLLTAQQTGREEMLIELGVARYAAQHFHGRTLGLEAGAQEFATPHEPTGPASATYRTAQHWASLAAAAGASIVDASTRLLCTSAKEPGCIHTLIRVGVPSIAGDSALVWLYSFENIERDASAETDLLLFFVRRAGLWSFVEEREWREAYLAKPD